MLYSASQVNKKGPCKTAAHGPCFSFTFATAPAFNWSLTFWNGYSYDMRTNFGDPTWRWATGPGLTGCDFNKQIRPFASEAPFGHPHPIGTWIFERI